MRRARAAPDLFLLICHLSRTKLLKFCKKEQVNEFIKVNIVIKTNFSLEKVIFMVSYVKNVNKSVP